ncbi:MAG: VWA domain-containing protein [Kofleriaceae bacterium]
MPSARAPSSLLLSLVLGCGGAGADGAGPDAGPDTGPEVDAGIIDCGQLELAVEVVHPDVVIALDRSCSMKKLIDGVSKWALAVDAITSVTTSHAGDVRWGLNLFPDVDANSCGQGASAIPVGDGTEVAIQALLAASLSPTDANYPDGPCVTNIDSAMAQAAETPAFAVDDRPGFVLLVTDGAQSGCSQAGGNAGTATLIGDLHDDAGITTFVVGFGDEVNAAKLNQFAELGGAPLAGATKYYQADDAAELDAALATIAGLVVSCEFHAAEPPPDLDAVYAFFDDAIAVPRAPDHGDGWDYDPATQTFTFYGDACAQLQRGEVTDIDFVYGCPAPALD